VTLTNNGTATLAIASVATSSAEFPILTNTCSTTLAPGASCTITVEFAPATTGARSGSLTITDDAPSGTQTVSLAGNGLAPCALAAVVTTAKIVRGMDAANFNVVDPHPSCFAAPIHMSCIDQGPIQCAFNPENVPPAGTTGLTVSKLSALTADYQSFQAIGQATPVPGAAGLRQAGVVLAVAVEDFSFSPYPASATITAGQSASYALALAPVNGLTGAVTLSCTGAPLGAACSVTPGTVTLGATPVEVSVKVTTTARSLVPPLNGPSHRIPPITGLELAWLAALLLVAANYIRRNSNSPRRTRRAMVSLAAVLVVVMTWAACGGGPASSPATAQSTPAGVYHLTVKGTYTTPNGAPAPATFTQETTLTLQVN
jgi:large repetitive protein